MGEHGGKSGDSNHPDRVGCGTPALGLVRQGLAGHSRAFWQSSSVAAGRSEAIGGKGSENLDRALAGEAGRVRRREHGRVDSTQGPSPQCRATPRF